MFNPSRLTLARQRRGRTKKELADFLGVSSRMVSKYESGDAAPSSSVVQALVRRLEFPEGFFEADTIERPNLDGVSFRALSSMRASQRDAVLASATFAVELSDWLADRFELPEANIPDVRFQEAASAAAAVRGYWGIGERPVKNMVHLLEAHGARVFSLAEESREVDAFSFWIGPTPYVFLNMSKSSERGRMDAAHELGHLVLHRHGGPRGRDAEHQADIFASAFLMPEGSVIAARPNQYNIPTLLERKRIWDVSAMALNYRMHTLGLISDWQYRSTCIELSQLGYRSSEPGGIPRETSKVFPLVFADLRADKIAVSDIANELHLLPKELDALIFGLVMLHVQGGRNDQGGSSSAPRHALRRL